MIYAAMFYAMQIRECEDDNDDDVIILKLLSQKMRCVSRGGKLCPNFDTLLMEKQGMN